MSILDPASPPADSIRHLFFFVLAITGAIFVLVQGMLIYCIVRFRAPPGGSTREPPQLYGSKPIEIAWTVAPLLTVFVLFLVVVRTISETKEAQPDALVVTVVGHQWWWEYRIEDERNEGRPIVHVANELHVPVGRTILLKLQSQDVVHSYWIPRLAGKTDVVPGRTNTMWFRVAEDKPGIYLGQCAEFCGAQHANMLLEVHADPPEKFWAWLDNQAKNAREVPEVEAGRRLFLELSCRSCHAIRGTSADGTAGPDLTHLMSRRKLASGMVDNDLPQLTRWIDDPQDTKPDCLMPSFKLAPNQVRLLVDYLRTLD